MLHFCPITLFRRGWSFLLPELWLLSLLQYAGDGGPAWENYSFAVVTIATFGSY